MGNKSGRAAVDLPGNAADSSPSARAPPRQPRILKDTAAERWADTQRTGFSPTHSCDECGQLITRPERFHCSECANYDVCVDCYPKRMHDASHEFSLDTGIPREVSDALQADPTLQGNLAAMLHFLAHAYADRRCFGWRARSGAPRWIKYRVVHQRALNVARALASFQSGASPTRRAGRGTTSAAAADTVDLTRSQIVQDTGGVRTVAIVGNNSPEWMIADFACAIQEQPVCPLYVTMRADVLCSCLAEAQAWCVFISYACLALLDDTTPLPYLRLIVVLDGELLPGAAGPPFKVPSRPGVAVFAWDDFQRLGEEATQLLPPPPRQRSDLFTIIYTSGSTGRPKGVMHAMESWLHSFATTGAWMNDPHVELSFAPMAHSSPRRFVWTCVAAGGRTFFVNDDMYAPGSDKLGTILAEAAFAGPVVLSSTPRLWNELYAAFNDRLAHNLSAAGATKTAEQVRKDTLVECRNWLGGRMRLAVIGGGSSSAEVQNWMFDCFQCMVNNGWGATEAGGIASGAPGQALRFGGDTQWRLRSVPELGYDANGDPPRGELLVKTPSLAVGYWKQADQTRSAFTADGFYATGDVVEVRTTPLGVKEVVICDRAKNFIKLAQGEFVAVEHLESLYSGCATVRQVCVHADSLQSFLVAIVVPNADVLRAQLGLSASVSVAEMCALEAVENAILLDMARLALREKLQGYETPRGLILTDTAFTAQNGMMTGSLKIDRRAVAKHFEAQLSARYEALSSVQLRLRTLLLSVLGAEKGAAATGAHTFAELGGDSLRAQRLQAAVQCELGVALPISMLLGQRPLDDVVKWVEAKMDDLCASTMGEDASSNRPLDVAAATALPRGLCFAALDANHSVTAHHFLTGATGFLGLYVLHSLLEVGSAGVTCLVRAKSLQHARTRLEQVASNAALSLDWTRVTLVLGDCAETQLGLSDADWASLVQQPQPLVVVHAAALVNSRLSYEQLYPSNAQSTRECIRLCGLRRAGSRLVYISTAGCVYPFVQRRQVTGTQSEGRLQLQPVALASFGGYSLSKLLGELMCYHARDAGLDVRILRPSTITPTATGHYNEQDTYSRILQACVMQRSCPALQTEGAHTINTVDVQWCANATVVACAADDFPEIINLVSERSTPWDFVFDCVQRTLADDMESVSYRDWSDKLASLAASDASHPLHSTLARYSRAFPYVGDFYAVGAEHRVGNATATRVLGGSPPPLQESLVAAHVRRVASATIELINL